ncbi:MAG: sigma-70 family RNA polymerase sigma factor [Planctomycetes bacterium]|nr:sigma-70 family RNA polymerase sigma factor [Planctomycetota bacterium]
MREDARDAQPVDAWIATLYDCLRELAARALGRESDAHTLQPTALVHEAYLRLVGSVDAVDGRAHFMAMAARVVREVLVDHARRRRAAKRGGAWARVTLQAVDDLGAPGSDALDLLALDEALTRLERDHPRAARVVELRYFSGLSIDETATALSISPATVDVDWRFARAWLGRALEDGDAA